MKTYAIETWGCQMNHHDTERLEGILRAAGWRPAPDPRSASLVLLNTCSVREKPVQKLLSRIGELAAANPAGTIGVCGCVAQQEGEELLGRSPSVGFVLGPGQVHRVAEALRALEQGRRAVLTGFDAEAEYNFHTIFRKSSTRGMVTVIEGCNEYCTFCVVPRTRGPEVSRPMDRILEEIRTLSATGIREVELLGQTINAYRCPETGATLADLLEAVARVEGLSRVRFITSHPRHFGDDLIGVLARHRHLSRYLHLPFQAGSNAVLRRMRRRYTREEYLDLVERIRNAVSDINLSTDVIVGFPGETDDDFEATLDLLERVRFGQVFAFAYSPRPRTPAARYGDQVPEEVKKERLARLFELTDRISRELNEALVGRTLPVLIDGDSRRDPAHWQGRTEDNRVVNFPKPDGSGVGDVVGVRITRASAHSLFGEAVNTGPPRLPLVGREGAAGRTGA